MNNKYVINIDRLKEGQSKLSFQENKIAFKYEQSSYLVSDLEVQLKIDKSGNEYAFKYQIQGKVILQCARCLKEYPFAFDEILENVYTTNQLYKNDGNYSFISQEQLDITDDIKEAILLAIPIKPLCNDNCKGIIY